MQPLLDLVMYIRIMFVELCLIMSIKLKSQLNDADVTRRGFKFVQFFKILSLNYFGIFISKQWYY